MQKRIEVGVLGATGMVGQQFIKQLAGHPWFSLTWLAASERSAASATRTPRPGGSTTPIPDGIADANVEPCTPGKGPKLVFSALDAAVAGEIEQALRRRRPLRRQQLPQPPDGPGGAAAGPGGRTPITSGSCACRRSSVAGRAPSSRTPTARPSCLSMALAPLRPLRSALVHGHDAAGGLGRGLSRRARRSTSSAT